MTFEFKGVAPSCLNVDRAAPCLRHDDRMPAGQFHCVFTGAAAGGVSFTYPAWTYLVDSTRPFGTAVRAECPIPRQDEAEVLRIFLSNLNPPKNLYLGMRHCHTALLTITSLSLDPRTRSDSPELGAVTSQSRRGTRVSTRNTVRLSRLSRPEPREQKITPSHRLTQQMTAAVAAWAASARRPRPTVGRSCRSCSLTRRSGLARWRLTTCPPWRRAS